jgi:hypothetical protein
MASRTVTIINDDLDNTEGASTREFSIGGQAYTIDLTDANYEKMLKAMSKYVQFGRKVGPRRAGRGRAHRISRAPEKSATTAEIRDWANKNGHNVKNRGRVPDDVVEAFNSANSTPAEV